jgi:threonine dehydratase
LDRVELVDEAAILEARRWLWVHLRVLVEPGAALGVAALTRGAFDTDPGPVGIVLCGANTDPSWWG